MLYKVYQPSCLEPNCINMRHGRTIIQHNFGEMRINRHAWFWFEWIFWAVTVYVTFQSALLLHIWQWIEILLQTLVTLSNTFMVFSTLSQWVYGSQYKAPNLAITWKLLYLFSQHASWQVYHLQHLPLGSIPPGDPPVFPLVTTVVSKESMVMLPGPTSMKNSTLPGVMLNVGWGTKFCSEFWAAET